MILNDDLLAYAKNGDLDDVKKCIENGADVNYKNADGITALMCSSYTEHLDIVKYLLENEADVNIQNINGYTALMMSSERGSLDIVKCLVDNGANVNAKNFGKMTALMYASKKGHLEIVKLLLDSGADVNIQNISGDTALHFAYEQEDENIIEVIQKYNTTSNNKSTNEDKITAIKKLAGTHFGGSIKEVAKFVFEYASHISEPPPRPQKNINLGRLPEELESFVMDITDRANNGKYSSAVFALLEYALKLERGEEVDFRLLEKAKISEVPIEIMSRRITRKKGIKFILSYSEYNERTMKDFYNYCNNEKLKTSEAFKKLINMMYVKYNEL